MSSEAMSKDQIDNMFELFEAVDHLILAKAMGWDMDVAFERLRTAKERVDFDSAAEAEATGSGELSRAMRELAAGSEI